MPLTDIQIKNLKPDSKTKRIFDGGGLYIEVSPAGGKLFRFKYRFNGKAKTLSLGKYPDVSLADARIKHQEARKQLAAGLDPSAAKLAAKHRQSNTFGDIALEWWHNKKDKWSKGHAELVLRRLKKNVLPWMRNRPITEITTKELLEVLRKIEARGAIETAKRIGQICNQIFIYAVASGHCENNIAISLNQALKERKVRRMPSITEPAKIAELLRALEGFQGTFIVKSALCLAPLVFVRPGELRHAEWCEFDLDAGMWTIPAEKMKMKRNHLVPLSKQAIEILRELKPLTGSGKYVFPSVRTNSRPMSENTLNVALRRLGYSKDEMVAHGFRSMASTRLHELGWKSEIIETQLAHADKNQIRGVYNRAVYIEDRKAMMQAWADYLDSLLSDEKVIPIRRSVK